MGSFGLDETKLKRVLELYKQITAQAQKMSDLNDEAKASTGKGGVEAGAEYLEKQIEKITSMAITPEIHKQNMAILTDVESLNAALTQAGDQILPQYELELSRSTKEAEQLAKASSTIREIFAQFGITFTAATVVRGFQELARSAFAESFIEPENATLFPSASVIIPIFS